jgi:hypothetical protein
MWVLLGLGESHLSGLVEIGLWFIENDESRAAKYRACKPDLLTTREANAAVANPSVVALRHMLNHLVHEDRDGYPPLRCDRLYPQRAPQAK